jgi:hypothetical protein
MGNYYSNNYYIDNRESNTGYSLLDNILLVGDTSLVVPVGEGNRFELGAGYLRLIDPDGQTEYIGYTHCDGTTFFNLTRGALGTTALEHPGGTCVYQYDDANQEVIGRAESLKDFLYSSTQVIHPGDTFNIFGDEDNPYSFSGNYDLDINNSAWPNLSWPRGGKVSYPISFIGIGSPRFRLKQYTMRSALDYITFKNINFLQTEGGQSSYPCINTSGTRHNLFEDCTFSHDHSSQASQHFKGSGDQYLKFVNCLFLWNSENTYTRYYTVYLSNCSVTMFQNCTFYSTLATQPGRVIGGNSTANFRQSIYMSDCIIDGHFDSLFYYNYSKTSRYFLFRNVFGDANIVLKEDTTYDNYLTIYYEDQINPIPIVDPEFESPIRRNFNLKDTSVCRAGQTYGGKFCNATIDPRVEYLTGRPHQVGSVSYNPDTIYGHNEVSVRPGNVASGTGWEGIGVGAQDPPVWDGERQMWVLANGTTEGEIRSPIYEDITGSSVTLFNIVPKGEQFIIGDGSDTSQVFSAEDTDYGLTLEVRVSSIAITFPYGNGDDPVDAGNPYRTKITAGTIPAGLGGKYYQFIITLRNDGVA